MCFIAYIPRFLLLLAARRSQLYLSDERDDQLGQSHTSTTFGLRSYQTHQATPLGP
jgi:hypothetical protein